MGFRCAMKWDFLISNFISHFTGTWQFPFLERRIGIGLSRKYSNWITIKYLHCCRFKLSTTSNLWLLCRNCLDLIMHVYNDQFKSVFSAPNRNNLQNRKRRNKTGLWHMELAQQLTLRVCQHGPLVGWDEEKERSLAALARDRWMENLEASCAAGRQEDCRRLKF